MECVTVLLLQFFSIIPSFPLSAQHVNVGPQIAFGDYREVSSDLHYRGTGLG